MSSPIQKLIESYQNLYNFLTSHNMLSEAVEVNEHYRKILLLSCASFYESEITKIIKAFVQANSIDERVFEFLNNKAIERQYHTYFDWKNTGSNINAFLGLFGIEFKQKISNQIKLSDDLPQYIKAFLEVGRERNQMVHENFLEYKLNKTFEEIVALHNDALRFISFLNKIFNVDN